MRFEAGHARIRFDNCEEEANDKDDAFMSASSLSANLTGAIESDFITAPGFAVASKWMKEYVGRTIDGGGCGKDGNSDEADTNDKGRVGELVSTNKSTRRGRVEDERRARR